MKQKNIFIVGLIALIVIVVVVIYSQNTNPKTDAVFLNQTVSTDEPIDIVLDFYDAWLEAQAATSSKQEIAKLVQNPIISDTLRQKLTAATTGENTDDIVTCQIRTPEKIKVKPVYELEEEIQFGVLAARDKELTGQALVDMKRINDGWFILDINCSAGEVAPEREFSFEKTGNLLKSVPPPLDSQYWHVVFTEAGQNGHTAPLFFDGESMCVTADGSETVCDEGQFTDAMPATVKGEMTEAGVSVKRIELE